MWYRLLAQQPVTIDMLCFSYHLEPMSHCLSRFFIPGRLFMRVNRTNLLPLLALGLLVLAGPAARADWPEFRGPWGDGHVSAPGDTKPLGLPLQWSETNNVRWKTEIPYRGWSTPVVMCGQVWLTTATDDGHDFFAICVDAETGQIRFNEKVFHTDNPEPLGNGASMNSYATPSAAIEPGRVYVHFGSAGTACGSRPRQVCPIQAAGAGPSHTHAPGQRIPRHSPGCRPTGPP